MTQATISKVANGRTFLFVPGDRPERFEKAEASGADIVVLDLEDAVAPDSKGVALGHVTAWFSGGRTGIVRINGAGTPTHNDEVAILSSVGAGIMLPKAETADSVGRLTTAFRDTPVVLLVETALGIENAHEIARVPGVTRLAFGSVDLAAQLGVDHASHDAMRWARSRLVNASAAAGVPGPIDGVTTAVADEDALAGDLAETLTLGFTGKLCIHPRQVPAANTALVPSIDEVAQAKRILDVAQPGGVTVLDGQMIDAPVVARAQRIVDAAALAR
jgi:citrate lyase subunit beta/citryl-CoA lyase